MANPNDSKAGTLYVREMGRNVGNDSNLQFLSLINSGWNRCSLFIYSAKTLPESTGATDPYAGW